MEVGEVGAKDLKWEEEVQAGLSVLVLGPPGVAVSPVFALISR